MKKMIFIGLIVYSTLFGWLGELIDHGNWFGGWSIVLGMVGCFFGIWAGYTVYKAYIE